MKEIGFRGRTKKKKWKYGLIELSPCDALDICPKIDDGISTYLVEPKTIGQFIGIEDSHNTRMYESDIVRAYSNLTKRELLAIVEFDENRLHFGFRPLKNGYIYSIDELLVELGQELYFEVKGNLFDNPELLECE